MHLWRRRLVYHGAIPPVGSQPAGTNPLPELNRRIREFYGLVHAGEGEAAWNIVAPVSSETFLEDFLRDLKDLRLDRWICTDTDSHQTDIEFKEEGFRATAIGIAHMRLWINAAPSGVEEHEFKQFWFYSEDQWWAMWQGIPKAGK